jgi:hypothetical protein
VKLFPAFRSNLFCKNPFFQAVKGASMVALFQQQKIGFSKKSISTAIRANQ